MLKKVPKDVKIPRFAKLGDTMCGMRYIKKNNELWRDGGLWGVKVMMDEEGRLVSSYKGFGVDYLHRLELTEITFEEWKECNGQYAPEGIRK